jgi:hypothetical protein
MLAAVSIRATIVLPAKDRPAVWDRSGHLLAAIPGAFRAPTSWPRRTSHASPPERTSPLRFNPLGTRASYALTVVSPVESRRLAGSD